MFDNIIVKYTIKNASIRKIKKSIVKLNIVKIKKINTKRKDIEVIVSFCYGDKSNQAFFEKIYSFINVVNEYFKSFSNTEEVIYEEILKDKELFDINESNSFQYLQDVLINSKLFDFKYCPLKLPVLKIKETEDDMYKKISKYIITTKRNFDYISFNYIYQVVEKTYYKNKIKITKKEIKKITKKLHKYFNSFKYSKYYKVNKYRKNKDKENNIKRMTTKEVASNAAKQKKINNINKVNDFIDVMLKLNYKKLIINNKINFLYLSEQIGLSIQTIKKHIKDIEKLLNIILNKIKLEVFINNKNIFSNDKGLYTFKILFQSLFIDFVINNKKLIT